MGVGLSISRGIIETHGGEIWGESNPSGGATFRFTLPTASVLEQP
jgi:two-component system sensor kinase FixL